MSRRLVTISMDDRLETARTLFQRHGFHHLLVLNGKRLVGVVSDRDLLKNLSPFLNQLAERSQDTATLNRRVHQVMTRQLVTTRPDAEVSEAAGVLLENRVSCLPVVNEDGEPVGMLSWRDILAAVVPPPAVMAESP